MHFALHIVKSKRRHTNASAGQDPNEASYAGRQARLRLSESATDRENILAFRISRRKHPVRNDHTTAPTGEEIELSVKMITTALDVPCSSTDKLVLLVLANYADDDGRNCFPSVATVVRQSGLSERTVQMAFGRLEKAGYLQVIHRRGRSNLFRVLTPAAAAPPPPQQLHPTPAAAAPISVKDPSFKTKNLKSAVRPVDNFAYSDESPLETVIERRRSQEVMQRIRSRLRTAS